MKKQILFLFIILLSFQWVFGQAAHIETETWAEQPKISTLDNKYGTESAVILFDKRSLEFADEGKDVITEYYSLHKIIHINDDRGIEAFNKIYLGVNDNSDIVTVKARTILPGGKIIELDKNDIKDLKRMTGTCTKYLPSRDWKKDARSSIFILLKSRQHFLEEK